MGTTSFYRDVVSTRLRRMRDHEVHIAGTWWMDGFDVYESTEDPERSRVIAAFATREHAAAACDAVNASRLPPI